MYDCRAFAFHDAFVGSTIDDVLRYRCGLVTRVDAMPGQIFEVSDEMRLVTRLAGRIVGARVDLVDLDQPAVFTITGNSRERSLL